MLKNTLYAACNQLHEDVIWGNLETSLENVAAIHELLENRRRADQRKSVTHKDGKEYAVSTVYVWGSGWETMVFPSEGGHPTDYGELDCDCYSTIEAAYKGHEAIVARWSDAPSQTVAA